MEIRTDDGESVQVDVHKNTTAFELQRAVNITRKNDLTARFSGNMEMPTFNQLAMIVNTEKTGTTRIGEKNTRHLSINKFIDLQAKSLGYHGISISQVH